MLQWTTPLLNYCASIGIIKFCYIASCAKLLFFSVVWLMVGIFVSHSALFCNMNGVKCFMTFPCPIALYIDFAKVQTFNVCSNWSNIVSNRFGLHLAGNDVFSRLLSILRKREAPSILSTFFFLVLLHYAIINQKISNMWLTFFV